MVRWALDDKKAIARVQKQMVYEEDGWGYETNRVAGYRCKGGCRRVFDLDILEVDHIIPKSKRGSDNPSNLQLLCPACNKKKSAKITDKAKSLIKRGAVRTSAKRTKTTTKAKPTLKKISAKPVKKKTIKAPAKPSVKKTKTAKKK
jgi:5-methylcytosine-specific restriction endonuclease McrA